MSAVSRVLMLALACAAGPALPQEKSDADAEATLSAVVRVRARILPDARTAQTLGARREGSGVLVREGYVLTIGYLVIEAEAIEVTAGDGSSAPATLAAYDHATGFGLLKLFAPLSGKPLPLGDSTALEERDAAMVVGYGGSEALNLVTVVSRRPFSGSWEYLLDAAIFTYPPVQNWAGAALISARGELLGVGSLIVPDAGGAGTPAPGNMFVPIELVKPILDALIAHGRAPGPPRPWLGLYAEELRGRLFVARVARGGPAELAGLASGDIIIGVGGEEVASLADFYRKVWARGTAGVEVPLRVVQGLQMKELGVRSIDRLEYFRRKPSY
ncbi:MAG: S1C family serine protease [Betaproteobacteria bacterium]|nr:S1C family serine protease [Betaproteobacteria bacterium]MDH5579459.1 S1C family serine protease [Betaproteobacteria bacterium]